VHSLFKKADELSHLVIGAAIEVHRIKGPGLIESIYEKCLMHELKSRKLAAVNQKLKQTKATKSRCFILTPSFPSLSSVEVFLTSLFNQIERFCVRHRP
jgi:hypothetical protein